MHLEVTKNQGGRKQIFYGGAIVNSKKWIFKNSQNLLNKSPKHGGGGKVPPPLRPPGFHTRHSNKRTSNWIRNIKFCTTHSHFCFKRSPKWQVFTNSELELNPIMLTSIPGLIGLVFLMLLASTETNGRNNKQSRVEFNETETMLQEVST